MDPTSFSLLDRLKSARPDASAWCRLHEVDLPLIQRWLGRVPGLGDDASDLAPEVLVIVFREVPRFDRPREGSFRAWLRPATVNKVRTYQHQRQRRPTIGLAPADGFLERPGSADPAADQWPGCYQEPTAAAGVRGNRGFGVPALWWVPRVVFNRAGAADRTGSEDGTRGARTPATRREVRRRSPRCTG